MTTVPVTAVRILLLADTHLGLDLPARPRVQRRRRGPEMFEAFERALAPARQGEVDLVVHGGDLLFRSRVPAWLVHLALAPLLDVADRGVPVLLVPGNHERGRIPFPLLARHPGLHIFSEPRTVVLALRGVRLAATGFPFERKVCGDALGALLERARWREARADVRVLCMHQAVEGARVGVHDFTFREGKDVVPGRAIPAGLAAVLSGHIHRAQVLEQDLSGRPLRAPVLYPGSTERTSFAEREEVKGYRMLELGPARPGGVLLRDAFVPLPSRPMVDLAIDAAGLDGKALAALVRTRLAALDPDAIVRVRPTSAPRPEAERVLSAPSLRALAPASMNVTTAFDPRRRNISKQSFAS